MPCLAEGVCSVLMLAIFASLSLPLRLRQGTSRFLSTSIGLGCLTVWAVRAK